MKWSMVIDIGDSTNLLNFLAETRSWRPYSTYDVFSLNRFSAEISFFCTGANPVSGKSQTAKIS